MKLNGLTNNLKDDKSLSNSYLQHIVELLRKELDSLQIAHNDLEDKFNEHDETQKIIVETKEVKADDIKSASIHTDVIEVTKIENGDSEINLLESAIEMFGNLKVNGHSVVTDEAFTGPFTYKGRVPELPALPVVGDVYAVDNTIYVWNGTSYDIFDIPVGAVSKVEYDEDRAETLADIADIKKDVNDVNAEVGIVEEDVRQLAATVGSEIGKINETLENKVDEAPVDDNAYVRKNGEWIEQSKAENTVKEVAGESKVSNTEEGVVIEAPKVEINSEDIKVNGSDLPETNKFALTKTETTGDVKTWYELAYSKDNPSKPNAGSMYGYSLYDDTSRFAVKATQNQKFTVTTRDYQYRKYCDSNQWADNSTTGLTSMDKNGHIKEMYLPSSLLTGNQDRNYMADWMVWNPEFCPEDYENKAYLFFSWTYNTTNKAYLLEYDNGEFAGSYDLTTQMTSQGATLQTSTPTSWYQMGEGGKALRNKDVERICWISHNQSTGGDYAVILGGDLNSKLTDKFDPSKCIYISLPATASPGYSSMAATDKAWYVSENSTGRIMRITPNGRVTEYNLSMSTYKTSDGDYIEYTDKNGKPACAFRAWVAATNGKQAMLFFEEREDGGVSFEEVDMSPYVYTGADSANWRMMENDYYIFFTAGYGYSATEDNSFPSSTNVQKLIYWDKKSHTTHIIDLPFPVASAVDWSHSYIGMYKTRGDSVWLVPHIQATLPATQRIGYLKYILNRDYTDIDTETGKDKGEIQVQTANITANHPWSACNNTYGWNSYPIMHHNVAQGWGYTSIFAQYACVNDDGIGFLMSPNYKAFALFYGEGNVKVYQMYNTFGKNYDFDPNVQQMVPDELEDQTIYLTSCEGLKHGWLIRATCYQNAKGYANMDNSNGGFVYIGLHYNNGEPTILERPTITILRKQMSECAKAKHMYDYYSYLLTYDDYERRKKVMRGTFMEIAYGMPTNGINGFYKEVEHNSKTKINLEYDGKVISSIEE